MRCQSPEVARLTEALALLARQHTTLTVQFYASAARWTHVPGSSFCSFICFLLHVANTSIDTMGNSQSNSVVKRPSSVPGGRYVQLRTPSGVVVHALGVFPCSAVSEQEVTDLIAAVKPAFVYVDLHPELVSVLEADVRAGRFGDNWRIPEQSPGFQRYNDAGILVSLNIRNLLADNEVLGLFGAEGYGPFKAAIKAALGLSAPSATASPAATRPAQLLAFPLKMGYNNGETLDRPSSLSWMLVGNASTGSSAITALVGNPNSWFYNAPPEVLPPPVPAADGAPIIDAGTLAAAASRIQRTPDVEHLVAIPQDLGYFTRMQVAQLQKEFRNVVNRATLRATAANMDVEADLAARETVSRAGGDAASGDMLAQRIVNSQRQSQALAFHLQQAADEAMAAHTASLGPGSGAPATPLGGVAAAVPAPTMVAVVNLGGLASLQRNWPEAHPPTELFPPITFVQEAIGNAVPVVLGATALYGIYRAGRRFPKTTAAVTLVAGAAGSAVVYSAVYGDWTRYGSIVRASLARPRVTSPLTRPIK